MPTAVQRQVPTTQKIQRSVEVRQVEFAREAVDVIVIVRRRLPTIQKVQKLVEVSKVQFGGRIEKNVKFGRHSSSM